MKVVALRDASGRWDPTEDALRESDARDQALLEATGDLVWMVNAEERFALAVSGTNDGSHLSGATGQFEDEHRMRTGDGGYRWMHARGTAVRDAQGRTTRMAGVQTDVTDRRSHDALTGLPNRALLMDRLGHSIRRLRRETFRFAVVFLDLDRFKLINDSLGHLAGDQLLTEFARRLEACVRPGDTVARFGGDEFVVLLDPVASEAEALGVTDRIGEDLRAPFHVQGNEIFISATLGIALGGAGATPEEILRDADTAMYRAKADGRARCAVFDGEMRAAVEEQLRLQNELRRAIDRKELRVHYQPIFELATRELRGVEALLRWQHPLRGLLLPESFLQASEDSGLLIALDRWVLREACNQARVWEGELPAGKTLPVSVNLSARQFSQPDLVEHLVSVLEETQLDPRQLKIELTESALIENNTLAATTIQRLSKLGVRFHVDDFGTGYSALSYLYRFPIETLKIDRSFVARIGQAKDGRCFVRAMLELASGLGIKVIAEGVETSEQLELLLTLGCGEGQGFFLARPLEAAAAGELMAAAPGCGAMAQPELAAGA